MISLFSKKSIISIIVVLSLVLMVGCSGTTKPLSDNTNSDNSKNEISNNTVVKDSENNSDEEQQQDSNSGKEQHQDNSQKPLLESIKNLAVKGKIINCSFPAKSTVIGVVREKWGKPDKSEWIPQAKGTYDTYSKHNVVFGYGKGDQIFEVRSFDTRLGQISLSMVKKFFGTPAYDVKSNGEEIIGYTAGKEFKILFVFPQLAKGSTDSKLKHYSVFYPAGTVNMMADDPGRQW